MLRRLRWLIVGYAMGFFTSWWLSRRVRRTVERYTPEHVRARMRTVGSDLRAAVEEGRVAMREREDTVRTNLDSRARATS